MSPDVVESGYITGLKLLNHYFTIPDKLQILDNTETAIIIADLEFGKLIYQSKLLPDWVNLYLGVHFGLVSGSRFDVKSLDSVEQVKKAIRIVTHPLLPIKRLDLNEWSSYFI